MEKEEIDRPYNSDECMEEEIRGPYYYPHLRVKIKGDKETVYTIFWVYDDGRIRIYTEKDGKCTPVITVTTNDIAEIVED